MYRELVLKSFEKAGSKIQREEPYPIAEVLVDFIEEKTNNTYTPKSLVSKYKEAWKGSDSVKLKPFVVEALCLYLGYPNFESFDRKHPIGNSPVIRLTRLWKKCWFKFLIYHLFLIILGVSIYLYATRQRWMIWEDDHYVEVKFDDKYGTRLKLYKQDRIDNFSRVDADCNTVFFNPDGSPRIWYGRNKDGVLQYFTDLGLHPETGKTLKKITNHMIDNYACPTD